MQRARAMERRRPEDELRHGLPARPAHGDALRAARGAHRHLQWHQLRAHDPGEPARSAAARPRAPAAASTAAAAARARAPAPARAAPAGDGARRATAGRAAEEARQEEAAAPRAVRPRPAATAAAAGDTTGTATATAGERAGQRRRRQRACSSGLRSPRPGGGSSAPSGSRAARVLPVHAVAAAEVGGDAAAARVLLGGVPVQLPDAGAGGHLQPRHRRQQAHHHLQRGEPQRLRHRLIL